MHLAKYIQLIKVFAKKISFDRVLLTMLMMMIFMIVIQAYQSLYQPIGQQQLKQLDDMATQYIYPKTRMLARHTLTSPDISYAQYLKVVHVYQKEQRQAQHLPALGSHD